MVDRAESLKLVGNDAFRRGEYARTISLYLAAAESIGEVETSVALRATSSANLAQAYIQRKQFSLAAFWAEQGLAIGVGSPLGDKLTHRLEVATNGLKGVVRELAVEDRSVVHEDGNKVFAANDFAAARELYERVVSSAQQDVLWLKSASNLALTYIKLEIGALSAETCREALKIAESLHDKEVPALKGKLHARSQKALLLEHIEANYRKSLLVTRWRPTRFTPDLCEAVFASTTSLFVTGQFLEVEHSSPRFLCTIGPLTCIAVFAWARRSRCRGFGAHIPCGAVMHGCLRRRHRTSLHVLDELVVALKTAFADVLPSDVEVHLVGGFASEDGNTAISSVYFPRDPQRGLFSWHVMDAVRSAGYNCINTAMLNAFIGESCDSQEIEMRLRRENQRFVCAALDTETGNIVTHTEHASSPVPQEWWSRENRLTPGGQALAHARAPHAEAAPTLQPPECPTQ